MIMLDAEKLSGMPCREFPSARTEYMRCQIGQWEVKPIKTGRFKESLEKVFRVRAFGATWDDALDMLERSKQPQL